MKYQSILGVFVAILSTQHSYADLPLTVENLISDQGKYTMELGLTYGNSKSSDTTINGYIPVQIADTSYINIPTNITNERVQNEYLIASAGLKYGLIKNLDLSVNASMIYQSNRYLDIDSSIDSLKQSTTDTDLADISIGLNYQFLEDAKYPALLGFIDSTALEKNDYKNAYFSSWTVGLTTYRSYDPIVLSLTAGYKHSLEREIANNTDYQPSDLFFLNPQVAFAANDRISLVAGLNFKTIGDQKLNQQTVEKQRNNVDYTFGLGYGLDNQSSLNLVTTLRQDFDNSNEVRLNYSKKF